MSLVTMIEGVSFRGYRSFSSTQLATLYPLSKVNLIVGKNNSGKSNVLRVIHSQLSRTKDNVGPFDRPKGDAEHLPLVLFAHTLPWASVLNARQLRQHSAALSAFFGSSSLSLGHEGVVWLDGKFKPALTNKIPPRADELRRALTGALSSSSPENARVLVGLFAQDLPALPRSVYVEGTRMISDTNEADPDLNGQSIKRRLSQLQNPTTDRLADRALFDQIQDFVRTVLDDAGITIDIPHDLSTIHVTQHGETLPIENLGTGVHEVVILAAAATITTDSVMCVEEPEVHMHPLLQRQLLRYLSTKTSNQYFIATHSAHLLDTKIGSIFHVQHSPGEGSYVRLAGTSEEHASIASDLGYRPSDLVQSNAVIWVEGPSDRIYLKSWIETLAPGKFIEGLHYSIMFYGGSLLKHLSPLDLEEVEEFISLRRLNRYMVVLIDSDRRSRRAKINDTKIRVKEGIERSGDSGLVWITDGYTIENYVPGNVLSAAIQEAHPRTSNRVIVSAGQWENPLDPDRTGVAAPSKTAIAKLVTRRWNDDLPRQLRNRVRAVITIIESANSHL